MPRIAATDWLLALLGKMQRALTDFRQPVVERPSPPDMREPATAAPANYRPLQRVRIAGEVARTAEREAGEAHIRFNSSAQAVASRIVRQSDKRLALLGVVHTHPGTLRHPSDGDFRGDIQWVGQLRGGDGVFGIGTADGKYARPSDELWQPRANMHCRGDLCFSWYSLREGSRHYQALPAELISGADLALPLRAVWPILEEHAERLDRLARQQAKVTFECLAEPDRTALTLVVPLAEPGLALRVVLTGKEVRYFLSRDGSLLAADLCEPHADRGVYRLLAELAGDE